MFQGRGGLRRSPLSFSWRHENGLKIAFYQFFYQFFQFFQFFLARFAPLHYLCTRIQVLAMSCSIHFDSSEPALSRGLAFFYPKHI